MSTIFTKIINREIPAEIVWEDENHIAFLSINPLQPGHTLVVPKQEIDYIFDLDEAAYAGLFAAAKNVAGLIRRSFNPKKVAVIVEGLEVPHAHIHLVPINNPGDLDSKNMTNASADELRAVAERIKAST